MYYTITFFDHLCFFSFRKQKQNKTKSFDIFVDGENTFKAKETIGRYCGMK